MSRVAAPGSSPGAAQGAIPGVTPGAVPSRFTRGQWRLVLALLALATMAGSWLLRLPCRQSGWSGELAARGMCFSDPPALYASTGMAGGDFPYLSPDALLEYPLLQTLIAAGTGVLTHGITGGTSVHAGQSMYFDLTVLLLAAVWIAVVLLASRMLARPRDAVLLATAPAVIATAAINWDLWPVLTVVAALLAFRRERWMLGGMLLGLGTALKLWPLLLLGALIVLAVRRREPRPALLAAVAATLTWLVIDLPFAIADPAQWQYFWSFSGQRGAGFSSIYHVWSEAVGPVLGLGPLSDTAVNALAYGGFALCCLTILVLGVRARREPTLEELSLLIVAAFVLSNKVYSPQFVLWLVPLVILARPRTGEFLVWQGVEVLHWIAIFTWLQALSWRPEALSWATGLYVLAVGLHVAMVLLLCGRIVLRLRRPEAVPPGGRDPANRGRDRPRRYDGARAARGDGPAILGPDRITRRPSDRASSPTAGPEPASRGAARHG